MNRPLFVAALALASAAAFAAKPAADPVLMTVDGKPVHVSEFEYLYNKNNTQQIEPQTLDQYLDMFTNYKLKVADAEHAGIELTPEFQKEFTQFRNELAAPYLRDAEVEEALIQESYNHYLSDVLVSHIMLPLDENTYQQLDSIRTAILEGKTTFEEEAGKWSVDRASRERGGLMGYVTVGRFPWTFEKASYDTELHQLSPVINSGVGYHIIRPEKRTPAEGEVNASHILLMTRGLDEAAKEEVHQRIDSIYNVLASGADFADVASRLSQDPGSARKGGSLGWFGRGAMVAEFDSTAFALADGELSKPFTTAFGYHIIKRHDSRKPGALDDAMRKKITELMKNDERYEMPAKARTEQLRSLYKAQLNQKGLDKVRAMIDANAGGYDSIMVAALKVSDIVVANFDGGTVTVAEAMATVPQTLATNTDNAINLISTAADTQLTSKVLDTARARLADTNPEYRNLVNEYRDGILLYDISSKNVWDKAAKDTEGLEAFFRANVDKYKFSQPKFKSYIIFATSDSILAEALAYAPTVDNGTPADFTDAMRKKFGREIKVERVIAAKGENPITDYLGFDGDKPSADKQSRWGAYGAYKGHIIEVPEEAADVRGAAVTDYQAELEKAWVADLHKKYKVKLNKKVFEQLKDSHK